MASRELQALLAPPVAKEKNGEKLEGPVRLKGSGEPLNLSFRNEVSLRSIFQTLGRLAGVNFLYDDTFRDTNLAIDLTGKELQQAVNFLCVASKNFSRVIDERTVIIVPDNIQKRMQYELNAIKTFYLSNIDVSDVQMRLTQMVKTQYKVPAIQVDKNLNSVTIRDTPQAVALAEKLLRQWDKSKGEVLIDIEIMEVDRIREKNLGIDLSNGALGAALIPADGSMDADGFFPIQGFDFGDLANYQMTVPSAIAKILSADSDTKIIAQPKIRGLGGEKMEYIVGQKVPIVNSTFAAIAAGGLSTQPIVNYTLQDIGITIKMTPRIHLEGEVTLEIELEVSSIAGEGTAGIPIIANRTVKNTVRLKDGETNLLAGLLRDEERRSVGGITVPQGHPAPGEPLLRDQEADRADRPRHDHHAPHHPARRDQRRGRQTPLGRSRQPLRRDRLGRGRGGPGSARERGRGRRAGRARGHGGQHRVPLAGQLRSAPGPRIPDERRALERRRDRQRLARPELRSPDPQAQGRPRRQRPEADGRQGPLLQVHQRRDLHHRLLHPARGTRLQGPRHCGRPRLHVRGPGAGVAGLHQRDGRRPDGPGHPPADGRGQRQHPLGPMVLVVAGPVRGGKTTFLEKALPQWAARGLSCRGFLSLAAEDAAGARVYDLVELATGRRHPYLRREGVPGAERIGPFALVPETLALARSIVRGAGTDGLLVVDEVGPLELGGGGLWPDVRVAALRAEGKLLLVAREEIVPDLVAALAPAVSVVFDIRDPGVRERLDEALFGTA